MRVVQPSAQMLGPLALLLLLGHALSAGPLLRRASAGQSSLASGPFRRPGRAGFVRRVCRPSVRAVAAEVADGEASPATKRDASSPLQYDWRAQWYAVCFEENLPEGAEPLAVSAFGQALALWRDGSGTLRAVADRCPHRLAKLSEGRVRNGDLECLYHGWAFEGSRGACVSIPQLADGAAIPTRACVAPHAVAVREGIVFVYLTPGQTDLSKLPPPPASEDDLDADRSYSVYSFQIDLPYEASFLVENLLDPAHIPVSHDRTPGGGQRENAQPLEMEVLPESVNAKGFRGRYRNTRARAGAPPSPPAWIDVRFEAPGIIYQRNVGGRIKFGAALHCMPLAAGRSRLLFRTYFKGLPLVAKLLLSLKPLWLRHLNSCKILEQDAGLISTQEDALASSPAKASIGEQYLPLRSADLFVVTYRKWLDRIAAGPGIGLPWAVGWDAPAAPALRAAAPLASAGMLAPSLAAAHRAVAEDRYSRHVRHCRVTRTALARVRVIKRLSFALGGVAALLAAALSPATGSLRAALGAVLALGAGLAAKRLEREFFSPFERREQLRLRERPV